MSDYIYVRQSDDDVESKTNEAADRKLLKRRRRRTKSDRENRQYHCFLCPPRQDTAFSSTIGLKEHLHSHAGSRSFICFVCEKTFTRRSALWNHRRLHSNEKPFQCELCPKSFKWKNSLSGHLKCYEKLTPADLSTTMKKKENQISDGGEKLKDMSYAAVLKKKQGEIKKPIFSQQIKKEKLEESPVALCLVMKKKKIRRLRPEKKVKTEKKPLITRKLLPKNAINGISMSTTTKENDVDEKPLNLCVRDFRRRRPKKKVNIEKKLLPRNVLPKNAINGISTNENDDDEKPLNLCAHDLLKYRFENEHQQKPAGESNQNDHVIEKSISPVPEKLQNSTFDDAGYSYEIIVCNIQPMVVDDSSTVENDELVAAKLLIDMKSMSSPSP